MVGSSILFGGPNLQSAMAFSGLRPPQFSEDVFYLPPWLEKLQEYVIVDHIRRSQSSTDQDFVVGEGCGFIDTSLLSNEEGRYTGCHLIISDSGNESVVRASPPRYMSHFQLHLSSDSGSQFSARPYMRLQEGETQQIQCSTQANDCPAVYYRSLRNMHLISEDLHGGIHHDCIPFEKNSSIQCPTEDVVNDVLGLCIAASEAIAVHETLRSMSFSEAAHATTVLEIVVRIKQAKIDNLILTPGFRNENTETTDSLLDLDDFVMADSFEDVGLSLTMVGGCHVSNLHISQMDGNCISEGFSSGCHCLIRSESMFQETIPRNILVRVTTPEKETSVEENLPPKCNENGCPMLIMPSSVTALWQSFNPSKKHNKVSFECQTNSNSYYFFTDSEGSGKDKIDYAVMENFHSRWFGGWTRNFLGMSCSDAKYLVREKKSLAETSKLSILLDSRDSKTNEAASVSSSVIKSSVSSSQGPLCSVVPCSVNSDCSHMSENSMGRRPVAKEYLNAEFRCQHCGAVAAIGGKSFEAPICKCLNLPASPRELDENVRLGFTSDIIGLKNEDINCMENSKIDCNILLDAKHVAELQFSSRTKRKLISISNHGICHDAKTMISKTVPFIQQCGDHEILPCTEFDVHVPVRKRVHSSDPMHQQKETKAKKFGPRSCLRNSREFSHIRGKSNIRGSQVRKMLITCCSKHQADLIFQGLEFLVTGFLRGEGNKVECLIWKYGGRVLVNIPSHVPRKTQRTRLFCHLRPIVLCEKKLKTSKFLYGCAVGAFILKPSWLFDSIGAGVALPPKNYTVFPRQARIKFFSNERSICFRPCVFIFDKLGIMLHGGHRFCLKFFKIVKQGGGQVFRSIHLLVKNIGGGNVVVGAIVAENKAKMSRHLKQCAVERKIPIQPVSWIIESLHVGKLLPLSDNYRSS